MKEDDIEKPSKVVTFYNPVSMLLGVFTIMYGNEILDRYQDGILISYSDFRKENYWFGFIKKPFAAHSIITLTEDTDKTMAFVLLRISIDMSLKKTLDTLTSSLAYIVASCRDHSRKEKMAVYTDLKREYNKNISMLQGIVNSEGIASRHVNEVDSMIIPETVH